MPDNRQGGSPASATGTSPSESTLVLIARAQEGDQKALDRLLARHLTPLRRWARGRLPRWARDVADTDDLVQDTLFRTFRNLADFQVCGPGALQAYLRQAIVNRVRDELRRKGRRPEAITFDEREADTGQSPLEAVIGRETIERYEQALAKLEQGDREAIIARVEMGYSYDELADLLGKPTADAARKAAQRALVRLVQHMQITEPAPVADVSDSPPRGV
jgi:RNA polymerase sigma-70 factor (ECF subfamily)